jgi:type IV secretory pathway VirB2 component (pilin)
LDLAELIPVSDKTVSQDLALTLHQSVILVGHQAKERYDSKMKPFGDISATTLALLISSISGAVATGCAFVSTIFIGAKLFNDEMSYGVPLSVGLPIAIITGAVVFFAVFRKMRSLAR